jgi:anthranilate synthase component 1
VAKDIRVTPTLGEAKSLSLAHNVVPVTHSFISDRETPVSAFLKLGAPPRSFLLESAEQGRRMGRYSFLGVGARSLVTYRDGVLTVEENGSGPVDSRHADPFQAVADLVASYRPAPSPGLPPLAGGAVGYFGYDLVRTIEDLPDRPADDLDLPEMAFIIADAVLVFDHLKHSATIVANAFVEDGGIDAAYARAVQRIAEIRAALARPLPADPPAPDRARLDPTSNVTPDEYCDRVRRIRDYIFAGDAFQVVPSQRFSIPVDVSAFQIYRGLRVVNPSPYMFYIAFDDFALAGSSPEPLVRVNGRRVETKPIAGTRRRGVDESEDRLLMDDLLADEKERAEHIMLVDLGRNDLGRVCEPGSVKVDELMGLELYSHVIHMVSTVSGTLAEGQGAVDALKACFPAGTVSGAPKVRAMQIIDELETTGRGPYAGAIGYLSYSGELDTCICIRTVVVKNGVAYVQAGGGVVADSVPESELQESRNKAAAMLLAVELAHDEVWQ